jgi:hypothetical protein
VYGVDLDGSSLKAIDKGAERYGEGNYVRFGEFFTKEDGTDREQRDSARRAHESYLRGWPVQAASIIRRDDSHRWGAATGQGAMRFVVALLLMSGTAMAQVQNKTYQDSMGRNTGRSVTDSRGNATFYDAMGRNTGRSVTSGNTTTVYDQMGRQTGTIRGR